jgi:hypothetical protein
MEKLPDSNDPIGWISYLFSTVESYFSGTSNSPDQQNGGTSGSSDKGETIGIFLVVTLMVGCCCAIVIYFLI